MIDANPAFRVAKISGERARSRVLSDDELRAFMSACASARGVWGDLGMCLLLTGQRLNEIARATTSEISDDTLTLSADRTKNSEAHEVPLSAQALNIVNGRPRINVPRKGFAYLFTTTGTSPVSGFGKARLAIHEKMEQILRDDGAGALEHWTFHDLRRTMTTRMQSLGVPLSVTEGILNHKGASKQGAAASYHHYSFLQEKRDALQAWADELDRIAGDG